MFTRIQALRYRCLRDIDQSMGPFATLVGPNASGKTTFLDVLALLGDIVRSGGDVGATILERSRDFRRLLWNGQGDSFQLSVEAQIPDEVRSAMSERFAHFSHVRYDVEIGLESESNRIGLNAETLWLIEGDEQPALVQPDLFPRTRAARETILLESRGKRGQRSLVSNVPGGNANYFPDGKKTYNPSFRVGREVSALARVPADGDSFVAATWFRDLLTEGVQTLTLNSQVIRQPSPPGLGRRFRPEGENLPHVLSALAERSPARYKSWVEHVQTALPDIESVDVHVRPEDRHSYLVVSYKGGAVVPSWLVSDGTLRLLALTVLAYVDQPRSVMLVEEPENGIHPRAIETVLQALSSIYEGQVLLATHSPVALNILEPADVLCFAKDASGATDIVEGDRHPALRDWRAGEPDFGVMFASGILS